jgi:hypothetical protein
MLGGCPGMGWRLSSTSRRSSRFSSDALMVAGADGRPAVAPAQLQVTTNVMNGIGMRLGVPMFDVPMFDPSAARMPAPSARKPRR